MSCMNAATLEGACIDTLYTGEMGNAILRLLQGGARRMKHGWLVDKAIVVVLLLGKHAGPG